MYLFYEKQLIDQANNIFEYETMWKFGKLLLKYKADIASNISYQDFDVFREYDIQPVLDRETMMLDYFENKKLYFLKWQDGILKGVY